MIRLVCLDIAGTTVHDASVVTQAVARALAAAGLKIGSPAFTNAAAYARDTMGHSKIEVFRAIFPGDETRAQTANTAFESAYLRLATDGVTPIPGAAETIEKLRGSGCAVALTTGFAPHIRDHIIDTLGWRDLVDLTLSPEDAGRGRPYPDLLLTALLRTGTASVAQIAAAGDTIDDLWAASQAGAAIVAGVRTGSHGDAEFVHAPHTHILDSVADLPAVIDAHNGRELRCPPEAR
ncbi:HAD family hydrolase [Mycobacterium talmoniae]|uniref:Haloacid dehalogenase n=1 Tax=Mycobacterium talmoniae TaxID=1858794 RepID=A0A1S1NES3_9MYCO|nr:MULTISPECIES: HAD family hydrolase [Mycobacterium]OHU96883.1 haloacid dehalogenase [Mycobacterium talmoniae]TDH47206.1 HAD family hydrolase [Mycobacterium eburneum]